MNTISLEYTHNKQILKGFLKIYPSATKAPLILVIPAWRGLDAFARETAELLAQNGYAAFGVDLYGDGKECTTDEEASACMTPLFRDRHALRYRLQAALSCALNQPNIDVNQVSAIGFCFGGLAALELWKSGAHLKSVVTFHALLGNSLGDTKADIAPFQPHKETSLFILHGHLDPLVSQDDLTSFHKLLTKSGNDWQQITYGKASHAFTNPQAMDKEHGLQFDALSAKRSFDAMLSFFKEKHTK